MSYLKIILLVVTVFAIAGLWALVIVEVVRRMT